MTRYTDIKELPSTIREVLSPEAQERYLEIYNQTWEKYNKSGTDIQSDRVAHSLAWDTVEKEYVQVRVGDQEQWYRRGEEPTVEESGASKKSLMDRIKSIF